MPPELIGGFAQWGAVGLLLGIAILTIFGKGVVSKALYDEAKRDLKDANATNRAMIAQVEKLTSAVEQNNTSQREILAWIHDQPRARP